MNEIQSLMQEQIKLRELYRQYVQMANESNKKKDCNSRKQRQSRQGLDDWRYQHQANKIAGLMTNIQTRINNINSNYHDNIIINDLAKEASDELQYSKRMLPGRLSDLKGLRIYLVKIQKQTAPYNHKQQHTNNQSL